MAGRPSAQILGKIVSELWPNFIGESLAEHDAEVLGEDRAVSFAEKTRAADGSEVEWLAIKFPFRDSKGKRFVGCVSIDVTERKRAEEALRESEEGLAAAQRIAHIGSWYWNVQTGTAHWSDETFRIFGLTPGPLENHRRVFLELIHPEDRMRVDRALADALNGIRDYDLNYRIRLADGTEKVIHGQAEVLKDENGKPLGIRGINHDITERKRAEAALRESELRFRRLTETNIIGVFVAQANGLIAEANSAFLNMLGYSREELGARLLRWDLLTSAEFQHVNERISEQLRASGFSAPLETEFIRRDQGRVPLLIGLATLDDTVHRAIAFVLDLSERKRAEAENARLATAIEQSAEAVMMTDPQGVIEYVNPAFTRITGYARDEVLGQNPRILNSGKQDQEFYRQLWSTILEGKTWQGEIINRRKDGSLYNERTTIAPVRNARGEITHFIDIKEDVTERKALELQLQKAAKMEAVGRLAGGVAHDFNNLLTVMNGYSELLLEMLASDETASTFVKEIQRPPETGPRP